MSLKKDLILKSARGTRVEGRKTPIQAASATASAALPPVILVAGPTASGKSALALELAAALGGTIINADALQIYRDLRILSARPDEAAMAQVPHRLYGYLDAAERGSVGQWRGRALARVSRAHSAAELPPPAGGTGLYLRRTQHPPPAFPPLPAPIPDESAPPDP